MIRTSRKMALGLLIGILSITTIRGQEYPIHLTDEGHIIIQVSVNDSIQGNFVLDTGAGINIVSGKLFDKIKEVTKDNGYYTGFRHDGDRLDGELYMIESLSIGSQKVINPIIGVYPPLDAIGIDGLLSLKFFEEKPFAIDYKNRIIRFYDKDELSKLAKNNVEIEFETIQHGSTALDIILDLSINNSFTIKALFDTGSGHDALFINPYFLNKLGVDKVQIKSEKYTKMLSGIERKDFITSITSISLSGISTDIFDLKNQNARFREDLIYEGLIGSRLFSNGNLIIDLAHKRMFFTE